MESILAANVEAGCVAQSRAKRIRENHMSIGRVLDFIKANDMSKCRAIHLLHGSESCFLLVFGFAEYQYERSPNATKLFGDFFGPEDIHWARAAPGGCPEGPGVPRWVVPTSVASRTPSLHYKFPNSPKPIGVTLDQKFRRRNALYPRGTNLDPFRHPARGGDHHRWPSSSSQRPPR